METIKAGMIGLDTSHCEAFVQILNDVDNPHHVDGVTVVAAYPGGSDLCAASRDRVDKFTRALHEHHDIDLCDSIEELAERSDAFFLESVDGRQHLEQFEILASHGKPVFIDKPLTCSHNDACRIAELAAENNTPVMSASALRFAAGIANKPMPENGVENCQAFGGMSISDDYPTYFWYAVHTADILFSFMGKGCVSVKAHQTDQADLLIGTWDDGRIGTVLGKKEGQKAYGCTLFHDEGVEQRVAAGEPPYYAMLMKQVVPFFQTGEAPIDLDETVEIMGFLEAAEISLKKGGTDVSLPG
ncbi:MAG: Gfo/Idh/MocA family oxidoreductase [Planctomycetes bacterium]|nr:Gfo/Idh/MocA family oxidoreductase [Planctomycetota bacterium]